LASSAAFVFVVRAGPLILLLRAVLFYFLLLLSLSIVVPFFLQQVKQRHHLPMEQNAQAPARREYNNGQCGWCWRARPGVQAQEKMRAW
jgi:hypothetical protein